MKLEDLKYPIGEYVAPDTITDEHFESWVKTIESLPSQLRALVENLTYEELDLIYRPKGWSIKQVVFHLSDSHMNSFVRFKLIMTEENPTLRPYQEHLWAIMPDANNAEIAPALSILDGVHSRWTTLLTNLLNADRKRPYQHPEFDTSLTLEWMLGMYDWHCRHHLAHIEQALKFSGAFPELEAN